MEDCFLDESIVCLTFYIQMNVVLNQVMYLYPRNVIRGTVTIFYNSFSIKLYDITE